MKKMFDDRVNCLREDFKEDLHRTKLSMQMNFIVQLERLRVKHFIPTTQIPSSFHLE